MKQRFYGLDGYGGPLYIGTGCFHRRDILCGNKFNSLHKNDWNCDWKSENKFNQMTKLSMYEQMEESKALASCTYEENTTWGKEVCPLDLVCFIERYFSLEKKNYLFV